MSKRRWKDKKGLVKHYLKGGKMNTKLTILIISVLLFFSSLLLFNKVIPGKSIYVKIRNFSYPQYSECSKCGGNWGWKKTATHMTSESSGLFLFCEGCDKIVTIEERWKALDNWKKDCIKRMKMNRFWTEEQRKKYTKEVKETEFIEFPRPRKEDK